MGGGTGLQGESTPQTLGQLIRKLLKQIVTGMLTSLPKSLAIAAVVTVINTYLLVVVNEGFSGGDPLLGMILVLQGNELAGALFWLLLGTLGVAALCQLRERRLGATLGSVGKIPEFFRGAFDASQPITLPVLLFGAAFMVAVMSWLGNLLIGVELAIVFLGAMITKGESLTALAFRLGYSDFQRNRGRNQAEAPFNPSWTGVAIAGFLAGMVLALLLHPGVIIGLVLGGVLAVTGYYLIGWRAGPRPVAPLLLFSALAIAAMVVAPVLADDGGWQESGGTFEGWVQSEGAAQAVANSAVAGVAAAAGASLGAALASGAAGVTGGTGGTAAGGTGQGSGPSTGNTEILSGPEAIKILEQNGLVTRDPTTGKYKPTPAFTNWQNNPLAEGLPLTGSRTVGEARDPKTGRVTDRTTVDVKTLGGIAFTPGKDGLIDPGNITIAVGQTGESGWQPVAPPPAPASPQSTTSTTTTATTPSPEAPKDGTAKPVIKPTVTPVKSPVPFTPGTGTPPQTTVTPPKDGKETPPKGGKEPPPKDGGETPPKQPGGASPPAGETLTPEEKAQRIKDLKTQTEKTQRSADYWTTEGRGWRALETGVGHVSEAADVAVDFLSSLTGKMGKLIKYGYMGTKAVGKNTLVVEGGAGLQTGLKEAVVEMGFEAASEVGGKILSGKHMPDALKGKVPPFINIANPADKISDKGMKDWTLKEVKEQLNFEKNVLGDKVIKPLVTPGTGSIVGDRIKSAAADAGQSYVRGKLVKDPLIKEHILKLPKE